MGVAHDREPGMTIVGRLLLGQRLRGSGPARAERTAEAERVSVVSHELRSPLAAMTGAARTLQERWHELSGDQRSSLLDLIVDETSRLARLVEDVLEASQLETGAFPYSFSGVDLGDLVRDTVAMLGLGQNEVRVVASVRDDPAPRVRGDRDRLRQVLTNVIENAVAHSKPGDEVDVGVWSEGGRVLVAVSDRGPGVAPEYHGVIFEKFGRAGTGSGRAGSGLGLFIARSIAEAHGGRLDVRSAPGQGATFTLDVPAASG